MQSIAEFIVAMVGPIVARVLAALGISFATYTGLSSLIDTFISNALGSYSQMAAVPLALLNMAGAGEFLHIITSAFLTRGAMNAFKKLFVFSSPL